MKFKQFVLVLSLVSAVLALLTGPAFAGVFFYQPFTILHDDNLDYVYDYDNSGTLTVNDRLVSVFQMHDSKGIFLQTQPAVGFGTDDLTGVADVVITNIDGVGRMTFAPTGAAGLLPGLLGSNYIPGTAIAAWLDPHDMNILTNDCITRAGCIALATDGALWMTAGFFGDPDDSWVSSPFAGGQSISVVENGLPSTQYGNFNFALNVGINNSGAIFDESVPCTGFCNPDDVSGKNGLVQVFGDGSILGGLALPHSEWTAWSKIDATVEPHFAAVPEPATLSLMGLGLLALAAIRFRK